MSNDVIIAFITGILGPILLLYVRHLLSKKKSKTDPISDTLRISQIVTNKLDRIKEEVDADRVWISQFHNGGNYYPTGKSMSKFSIIYETLNAGINSIQTNFQNIPVNLFSKSITKLLEDDLIEIPDFENDSIPKYGIKYVCEDGKIKSTYLFAIKTVEDKFIGCLGIDFITRKSKFSSEMTRHLCAEAGSLGGVLISYLAKN